MLLFDFQDLSLALRFAKMMKRYGYYAPFVKCTEKIIICSKVDKTELNNVGLPTSFTVVNKADNNTGQYC